LANEPPQLPRKSITKQRKQTSHTFHLIMTIITAGVWGVLVWLPMILWHKFGPRKKIVTKYR
jgi:hypothetical protein